MLMKIIKKSGIAILLAVLFVGCKDKSEIITGPFLIKEGVLISQKSGDSVTGIAEWYYENGQLMERTEYRNGVMHGLSESYHPNGQLSYRGKYSSDIQIGVSEYYEDDGYLKVKYIPAGELLIHKFYTKAGNIDSIEPYKNGKLHGMLENFDSEGNLKEKKCYQDGEKVDISLCN